MNSSDKGVKAFLTYDSSSDKMEVITAEII